MIEVWKQIQGYEGLYEVSNTGRIRGVDRIVPFKDRTTTKKGKIKNQRQFGDYLIVGLCKNAKVTTFLVHRLVAIAFVNNPENKPTVNHKDFNPFNNCADNLEWATQKENINSSVIEMRHCHGETHGCHKLTEAEIKDIRMDIRGSRPLSKIYGVSHTTIKRIRNRKLWRHLI